ncbi:Uncharacterized protein GBIM_20331 [Gryllus bimaculatus]|nr:Uncharacterized protein GBIM_20331 [Gryllus bimaculatus]
MDHSVKAMASQRRLALGRLLNRHRFENDELEALYQRYIFKLQHGSVASAVGLFVLLTGVLANLSLAHAHAPTPQNVYHCVHCVLFALLLAFLNTRLMQDAYLLWVCYAVLFFCATFCAVALPLGPVDAAAAGAGGAGGAGGSLRAESRRVAAEGAWHVVFVVFLAYALMPLRAWVAAAFGLSLGAAHLLAAGALARDFPHLTWRQLTANALVFLCVNVAGAFMHNLMERAQRKAFLDTRNCIAARLEMEDENEKLYDLFQIQNDNAVCRAAAAVRPAAARSHGDEGGHRVSGGGPVPQDLHPEAREREVSGAAGCARAGRVSCRQETPLQAPKPSRGG